MKKYDVIALGELLIDYTDNGISAQGNPLFEANPGGAPCNVLAMLRKLDKNCAFVGKVGNDIFTAPDFETAAGMAVNSSFRLLKFKTAAIAEVSEGRSRIAAQYGQTGVNQHSELSELQNALCEKLVFEANNRTLDQR